MNDDEVRALIRVAIAKHLSAFAREESGELRRTPTVAASGASGREGGWGLSFSQYPLPRAEGDSQCLIEPAVRCNHCGYCECHGH